MLTEQPCIAVIGAHGAVGRETLSILTGAGHPAARVRALSTRGGGGDPLPYGDEDIEVGRVSHASLIGFDAVILCGSSETARAWAPVALRAGALVIDHSSAFRGDESVPLVIPEINQDCLVAAPRPRLAANPNCSATQLALVLHALGECAPIERVHVATYQAVSGAGLRAIGELEEQSRSHLAGEAAEPRIFPEPIAFNVFPHESPESPESGLNEEESKLIFETRRLLGRRCPRIAPTCVRVPVFRAHSQALSLQFSRPIAPLRRGRAIFL